MAIGHQQLALDHGVCAHREGPQPGQGCCFLAPLPTQRDHVTTCHQQNMGGSDGVPSGWHFQEAGEVLALSVSTLWPWRAAKLNMWVPGFLREDQRSPC